MLSQARLAHIFLIDVLGLWKPVATGEDRNPAVHAAEFEKIEHAAAFVRRGLIQFHAVACFGENLSEGDVAQPRIPIPENVGILVAARC